MSLKTITVFPEASPLTLELVQRWATSRPFLLVRRQVDFALTIAKVSKEAPDLGTSAVMPSGHIDLVEVGAGESLRCYKDRSGVQLALATLCSLLLQSIAIGLTVKPGQWRPKHRMLKSGLSKSNT